MPKIRVKVENVIFRVPEEYCDKGVRCYALHNDERGYHCGIFDTCKELEFDRQVFAHKRCEKCRKAEVKE